MTPSDSGETGFLSDLETIAERALALMRELGAEHLGRPLQDLGWTFRFDGARRRLGLCQWMRGRESVKSISLSRAISAREGWSLMEDVARHEIAHALDFETRGHSAHDETWKAWARRCGADPTRAYEGEFMDDPASRYLGRCLMPGCTYVHPFYRSVTAAYVCVRCKEDGRRSFLRIEERRTGRVLREGGSEPGAAPPPRRPKYVGRCGSCGGTHAFARRPSRRHACAACCRRHSGGRFDHRFELVVSLLR